jgi:hypothetical protein
MKRNWPYIIIGAIVLLIVIIAATACGGDDSGTATTTAGSGATTTATGPIVTHATAPSTTAAPPSSSPPATTQAPTTTTVAAAAGGWVEVTSLEGNDKKQGEVFTLSGAPARLSYKVTSTDIATLAAFYVMAEGTVFITDGGIPEVMVGESGEDSTTLTRDAGNYYLWVMSSNCDWEVTVEEQPSSAK